MIFLNTQIDLFILKTDVDKFTSTYKKTLHLIFQLEDSQGKTDSNQYSLSLLPLRPFGQITPILQTALSYSTETIKLRRQSVQH